MIFVNYNYKQKEFENGECWYVTKLIDECTAKIEREGGLNRR